MPGALDANGFVVADIPCRKCGYNLRGLQIDGRCPECGRAVGLSVQGDLLRFSDPRWLHMLHRGARQIIWGVVALVAGGFGAGLLTVALPAAFLLVPVIMVVGYGLIVVGSWLLTEPDPSGIGEDQYGTARKIIRITLVLGLIDSAIDLINTFNTLPPEARQMLVILQIPLGIAAIVGMFAQLRYLRKLAMRIPDLKLAGRAHFLTYAIAISYGALLLAGVAMAIVTSGAGPGPRAFAVVGILIIPVALAFLVFAVMYLFMLERLAKRFKEEANVAEQTWARADALPAAAGAPNVA